MEGLIRSLKYATFRAGRVILVTLLMSVGFIFYFTFLDGGQFTVPQLVSRFPSMLVLVGNLMFMLYGMLDVATYTQLTLTYGCTRKNAAVSTFYMQILQILAVEAAIVLFYALVPADWAGAGREMFCVLALVAFLTGSGFALVTGILIHRFGKAAYILVVVICTLGGGVIGGLVTVYSRRFPGFMVKLPGMWGFGVAAAVWYAAAALIFWLFIRKIEVRV